MSVSDVGSVNPLSKGVSTQSVNGNNQVVSLDGGVSTMGSSGGITCYKAACSSGYYLDAPNSTYFTSTSKSGTLGLTCYKATGCKSGYYNGGSSYDYHGYKCSKCTYSCPSGYYEAGSTWTNYKLTSDSAYKVCNGDSSQKNSEKCYKRTYKTCTDYDSIYKSSIPSGQTCTPTYPRSGLTCYKDCKDSNYTVIVYTSASSDDYTITSLTSDVSISGSGYSDSDSGTSSSGADSFTFSVPAGTYTVSGDASIKVKSSTSSVATFCANNISSTLSVTKSITVPATTSVSLQFTCNKLKPIKPIVPDPCSGSCPVNSDVPYYKVLQGNKCCCPTSGETNSIYCNCCKNTTRCPSNLPYPWVNSKGDNCCCADLDHTGGSSIGNWETPTSCLCGF